MTQYYPPEEFLQGYIQSETSSDGYLRPVRFSSSQTDEYKSNEAFLLEVYATSGMCFHFSTDAAQLSFHFRVSEGSVQDLYSFDTCVDEALYSHFQGRISDSGDHLYSVEFPEGVHDIRIYLPNLAKTEIGVLKYTDSSFVSPIHKTHRLLVMGDSITQGYIGSFPSLAFPATVARKLNAELLNQGIGGESFHPEIVAQKCEWFPTQAVICYGTNEWVLKDRTTFIREAADFYSNLSVYCGNIPIAVVTPVWRADKLTRRKDSSFNYEELYQLIRDATASHTNMFLIDGHKIMPEIPELMADSSIHPNDLGNVIYGSQLYELLPGSWKH